MFMTNRSALMTTQNATLDSKRTLSWFVSYRRLSAQFQFSLSADTLGYLSQWVISSFKWFLTCLPSRRRRGGGGRHPVGPADTGLFPNLDMTAPGSWSLNDSVPDPSRFPDTDPSLNFVPWLFACPNPWLFQDPYPWLILLQDPLIFLVSDPWQFLVPDPWLLPVLDPWMFHVPDPWLFPVSGYFMPLLPICYIRLAGGGGGG